MDLRPVISSEPREVERLLLAQEPVGMCLAQAPLNCHGPRAMPGMLPVWGQDGLKWNSDPSPVKMTARERIHTARRSIGGGGGGGGASTSRSVRSTNNNVMTGRRVEGEEKGDSLLTGNAQRVMRFRQRRRQWETGRRASARRSEEERLVKLAHAKSDEASASLNAGLGGARGAGLNPPKNVSRQSGKPGCSRSHWNSDTTFVLSKLRNLCSQKSAGHFKELFRQYDTNLDGELDLDEIRTGINNLGFEISTGQAGEILNMLDENADGRIQFCEFRNCIMEPTLAEAMERREREKYNGGKLKGSYEERLKARSPSTEGHRDYFNIAQECAMPQVLLRGRGPRTAGGHVPPINSSSKPSSMKRNAGNLPPRRQRTHRGATCGRA